MQADKAARSRLRRPPWPKQIPPPKLLRWTAERIANVPAPRSNPSEPFLLLHFKYQPAGSDAHAHPFTNLKAGLLHPLPLNPQERNWRHNAALRFLEDPRPWITLTDRQESNRLRH